MLEPRRQRQLLAHAANLPCDYLQRPKEAIAIECDSAEEVDRLFKALSAGGTERMSPQSTFWAVRYANFTDRFGITWQLDLEKPGTSG
ncbi:MAG TPA: VOC family protein [Myxococcales bacterium]|nr:VOC family protein [Myxococcales bacterium]